MHRAMDAGQKDSRPLSSVKILLVAAIVLLLFFTAGRAARLSGDLTQSTSLEAALTGAAELIALQQHRVGFLLTQDIPASQQHELSRQQIQPWLQRVAPTLTLLSDSFAEDQADLEVLISRWNRLRARLGANSSPAEHGQDRQVLLQLISLEYQITAGLLGEIRGGLDHSLIHVLESLNLLSYQFSGLVDSHSVSIEPPLELAPGQLLPGLRQLRQRLRRVPQTAASSLPLQISLTMLDERIDNLEQARAESLQQSDALRTLELLSQLNLVVIESVSLRSGQRIANVHGDLLFLLMPVAVLLLLAMALIKTRNVQKELTIVDLAEAVETAGEQQLGLGEKPHQVLDSALVASLPNAIISIDQGGKVLSANPATEAMFGYASDELVGENISILMPEKHGCQHDRYLAKYLLTGEKKVIGHGRDVEGLRKDGSLIPVHLSVAEVKTDEQHFFVGMITDITELREIQRSLTESRDAAEHALMVKSSFLANMSHEIRTPMNAIIGMTELVLDTELEAEQHKHLSTVYQSARNLLGILNSILDLAKLENGQMALSCEDFNLAVLLDETLDPLRYTAQRKGLKLDCYIDDGVAGYYNADVMRIRQVITNLVGNSIKFTEKGQVVVSVEPSSQSRFIRFAVSDTGIGMTEEQTRKVFDSFSQADDSITRRFGGTGLGTTISKQFVELMGGTIDVTSEPGKGSCFSFDIPMMFVDADDVTEVVGQKSPLSELPPLNILAADDQPANRELLFVRLGRMGHQVQVAADGAEAVKLFKEQQFDLLLMDVHMPVMDGFEATRNIRQYEAAQGLESTPIVALTASVLPEDRSACVEAGMNSFVTKPVDFDQLKLVVSDLINYRTIAIGNGVDGTTAAASSPEDDRNLSEVPPLIAYEAGLQLWGQDNIYQRVLQQFSEAAPAHIEYLSHWGSVRDEQKLIEKVHAIKGVSANLKLKRLCAFLDPLEGKLRNQALESSVVDDSVTEMISLINQTVEAIESHIHQSPLEGAGLSMSGAELDDRARAALIGCLCELRQSIEAGLIEPQYIERLEKILPAETVQPIADAMDGFDFTQALALVSELENVHASRHSEPENVG